MQKQNVVYPLNGLVFSNATDPHTCYNSDELQKHGTKSMKPDTKDPLYNYTEINIQKRQIYRDRK